MVMCALVLLMVCILVPITHVNAINLTLNLQMQAVPYAHQILNIIFLHQTARAPIPTSSTITQITLVLVALPARQLYSLEYASHAQPALLIVLVTALATTSTFHSSSAMAPAHALRVLKLSSLRTLVLDALSSHPFQGQHVHALRTTLIARQQISVHVSPTS